MNFSVTTIYKYDRLLGFNFFLASRKRLLWIMLALLTALFTSMLISNLCFGNFSSQLLVYVIVMWCLSLVFLGRYFILPRFTMKRAPGLDMKIKYEFDENGFVISVNKNGALQKATHKYSHILKVMQSKTDIYLFTTKVQCFIIDKSGFSVGTPDELLAFLKRKGVPYKR